MALSKGEVWLAIFFGICCFLVGTPLLVYWINGLVIYWEDFKNWLTPPEKKDTNKP